MSAFLSAADKIKERIDALLEMDGTYSVVDRQADINAEFVKAIRKKCGLVVIEWLGGRNVQDGPIVVDNRFVLTLFTKPVLRQGMTPADDIVVAIAKALHDWNPDPDGRLGCHYDFRLTEVGPSTLTETFLAIPLTFQASIPL